MNHPWRLQAATVLLAVASRAFAEDGYEWLDADCPSEFNIAAVIKLPAGGAKAKLVFDYADKDNHCAVALADGELKVIQVSGGKVAALWPACKLTGGAAQALLVKRRHSRLAVFLDGELVGQVERAKPAGGRAGTTASGGAQFAGVRMQETAPVYFADDFMRTEDQTGSWETVSGEWQTKSIESVKPDPAKSANPFSYGAVAKDSALTVAGNWFWDSYLYRVAVKPEAPGAVGLVVFYQDPQNHLLFRWWAGDTQHLPNARELVLVRAGKEQVLASAAGAYQPGQWYRLTVKATDARVEVAVDGKPALSLDSPPFGGGKVGLYAEHCKSVSFDDVLCRHWASPADDPSPRLDAPRLTAQFTKEDSMKTWANPDSDWTKGDDDWWWHCGEFWGDASFGAELPEPGGAAATAAFTIHADRNKPQSGYMLTADSAADGSKISYALTRQGKSLGSGTHEVGEWPVSVEVRRNGRALLVEIGEQCVLSVTDAAPLAGTASALKTTGVRIPTEQLFVTGTHCIDDTFATAPVEWWQGKGNWQVTNRWNCSPDWTWMASTGSIAPVLWTKRAFAGDFLAEAYVCNKMDLQAGRGSTGYSHPGDLNMTVCGDGRSLNSGYSFLYAGWDNSAAGMFRQNDECVPRDTAAVLVNPTSRNPDFHHHWFDVRVERRGGILRHWVDGKLIHEYTDPNPLPAGRVALWDIGTPQGTGGLVIARARIWYENEAPAQDFPPALVDGEEGGPRITPLPAVPADAKAVKHDFETDRASWSGYNRRDGALCSLDSTTAASGKQSLKIENAGSGGDFSAWAGVGAFEALKLPKLKFAYKLPADVKVNVYVHAGGRYYAIEFTGGPQPEDTCPMLGKIENVRADNQWHTAEFALGKALATALPGAATIPVDQLCFSAPRDTYYQAGLGGNGWGATWHLDDFELAP